jgi:hypothetical protein
VPKRQWRANVGRLGGLSPIGYSVGMLARMSMNWWPA